MSKNRIGKILCQFFAFGIVGISNTLISYVVFAFLVHINIHYLISNMIAFFASVLNAFYWNNKYVFKEKFCMRKIGNTFFKCIIAYSSTSLFLASALLFIWIDCFNISPYIGQIINLFITIPLNFFLNKYWAFN